MTDARPRLLDLFCGAGGASMGYHRAGFAVVGVDCADQPRYPFPVVRADAFAYLRAHGRDFDAIHASPPCQRYAYATHMTADPLDHPDLVDAVRDALRAVGRPFVIENVAQSPLRRDLLLCGTMFGLPIKRHRVFETSWNAFVLTSPCNHATIRPFTHKHERAYADAMGCDWMRNVDARQAIPPAYTAFLGEHLRAYLEDA